jgi:hypothetical protein
VLHAAFSSSRRQLIGQTIRLLPIRPEFQYNIFMKKPIMMLLFLLSVSLVLQNTCPYGFAAKTAFAASHTHACPLHHSPPGGTSAVDDNSNKVHPAFVIAFPFVKPAIQRFALSSAYVIFSFDKYINPFKDPLTKPPVA